MNLILLVGGFTLVTIASAVGYYYLRTDNESESSDPLEDKSVTDAASESGSKLQETLTKTVSWTVATSKSALLVPAIVLSPILTALPPTWRLYHKIHRWSAWQMQKAANADALANYRSSSTQEDVRPAAWVEGEEDEKDRTGWAIKGVADKRYDAAVHGQSTSRFGKANMIHIDEDSTEQGTWAEACIDNALQFHREKYLFRNATLETDKVVVNEDGQITGLGNGGPEAIADGGSPVSMNVSIKRPGICEDALVPISSREGYDGQVISWNQYQNLKEQQSDQETIRDAKNSAWAAAKLDEIEGVDLLKWALILAAWSALLLFKDAIAAAIAGIAGGGGGGGAVGTALGMINVVGMLGGI